MVLEDVWQSTTTVLFANILTNHRNIWHRFCTFSTLESPSFVLWMSTPVWLIQQEVMNEWWMCFPSHYFIHWLHVLATLSPLTETDCMWSFLSAAQQRYGYRVRKDKLGSKFCICNIRVCVKGILMLPADTALFKSCAGGGSTFNQDLLKHTGLCIGSLYNSECGTEINVN